MSLLIVASLLPFLSFISVHLFKSVRFSATNFEGKHIPYSLGLFALCSYFIFSFFLPSTALIKMPFVSFYLMSLWVIGLLDDVYGDRAVKGIKGHLRIFFSRGIVTTGLLKIIGSVVLTSLFIVETSPTTFAAMVRYGLLLILMPHLFNLFDTRPLRVWKVTMIITVLFLPLLRQLSLSSFIFMFSFFYSFAVFERERLAMLGDNGAMFLGGIVSVLAIFYLSPFLQSSLVVIACLLTVLAEFHSFHEIIIRSKILTFIDRLGWQRQ